MSPLNTLMNHSAEFTQQPSYSKNIQSRFLTVVSLPVELIASLENAIKLPFQAAACTIKIYAKILDIFIDSKSLQNIESRLTGPIAVLKTALKIVGYAIGSLFTLTLGILSPYKNFQLHCSFGLITNKSIEKQLQMIEENRKKEIAVHEKSLEIRLGNIVEAMRRKTQAIPLPLNRSLDERNLETSEEKKIDNQEETKEQENSLLNVHEPLGEHEFIPETTPPAPEETDLDKTPSIQQAPPAEPSEQPNETAAVNTKETDQNKPETSEIENSN